MAAVLRLAVIADRHDRREAVDDRVEERDPEERREARHHAIEAHEDQERDAAEGRDPQADAARELLLEKQVRTAAPGTALDDAPVARRRRERGLRPALRA